jgi:hypothetical protein
MNDDVDPFIHDDAAYVMGALSATDRDAFEAHLVDCPQCAQSVAELSGVTERLAMVPLARVLHPETDREPPPELLLPRLLKAARAERRRRSVRLVATAPVAASVMAIAVAIGTAETRSPQPAGVSVAMTPVRLAAVTATLQTTRTAWGTRVSLDCHWAGAKTGADATVKRTYRLVAVPRDGGDPQVLAQWAVMPGQDVTVVGSTDLATTGIATFELRAVPDDTVLLRARPS